MITQAPCHLKDDLVYCLRDMDKRYSLRVWHCNVSCKPFVAACTGHTAEGCLLFAASDGASPRQQVTIVYNLQLDWKPPNADFLVLPDLAAGMPVLKSWLKANQVSVRWILAWSSLHKVEVIWISELVYNEQKFLPFDHNPFFSHSQACTYYKNTIDLTIRGGVSGEFDQS